MDEMDQKVLQIDGRREDSTDEKTESHKIKRNESTADKQTRCKIEKTLLMSKLNVHSTNLILNLWRELIKFYNYAPLEINKNNSTDQQTDSGLVIQNTQDKKSTDEQFKT